MPATETQERAEYAILFPPGINDLDTEAIGNRAKDGVISSTQHDRAHGPRREAILDQQGLARARIACEIEWHRARLSQPSCASSRSGISGKCGKAASVNLLPAVTGASITGSAGIPVPSCVMGSSRLVPPLLRRLMP